MGVVGAIFSSGKVVYIAFHMYFEVLARIAEFFDVMWEYGRMGLYEHG